MLATGGFACARCSADSSKSCSSTGPGMMCNCKGKIYLWGNSASIGTGPGRKIKWRTDVSDHRDLRGVGGERLPEAREAKPAVKSCWTGNDVLQRAGIDLRAHRLISLFTFFFIFFFFFLFLILTCISG